MSLVPIFGQFYLNKNLAIEFSMFLPPEMIIRLVGLNKRCHFLYS